MNESQIEHDILKYKGKIERVFNTQVHIDKTKQIMNHYNYYVYCLSTISHEDRLKFLKLLFKQMMTIRQMWIEYADVSLISKTGLEAMYEAVEVYNINKYFSGNPIEELKKIKVLVGDFKCNFSICLQMSRLIDKIEDSDIFHRIYPHKLFTRSIMFTYNRIHNLPRFGSWWNMNVLDLRIYLLIQAFFMGNLFERFPSINLDYEK